MLLQHLDRTRRCFRCKDAWYQRFIAEALNVNLHLRVKSSGETFFRECIELLLYFPRALTSVVALPTEEEGWPHIITAWKD